jgi:cyclopropane fatty-acyl-phospholipid synthase-like methyltransferase
VLDHSDMLAYAAAPRRTFDVVFSSFAMHHLDLAQKAAFLKNVRAALKPDGVMILVDLARDANEDRTSYLDNYLRHAEAHWAEITPPEMAAIRTHASSHDYPEKLSTYRQLAINAGFSRQDHLCQHTWHHALAYQTT